MDYNKTINLPKTNFSMKANLAQKEPLWLEIWEKTGIYNQILTKNKEYVKFILHDGPPYANGDIHLGHALNKILKDTIIRFKLMDGFFSPYVPGWDCHGLPTEQEVAKKFKIDRKAVSIVEWRQKCREIAWMYIDRQREQFKRLGVFGDWSNPYITLDNEYEANQIKIFAEMYFKGFLYRDFKTVLWCPHCETSLAEAEIEYKDKLSPSIFVKFPFRGKENTFFLVWTTTPWTLPGNRAIAVHPQGQYALVNHDNEKLIILNDRLPELKKLTGTDSLSVEKIIIGKELSGLEYLHPLYEEPFKVIAEDWVSLVEGTGIVHIAPGHGDVDHLAGKKYDLDLNSPVDEKGVLTPEAKQFAGLFYKAAEKTILEYLVDKKILWWSGNINHSYPHCWRCHKPVIYRAALQWFVNVDRYRKEALENIEKVDWLPEGSINRIKSMVTSRPDWCLSRQRVWGVPIPVFYCRKCQEVLISKEIIDHLYTLFLEHNSDIWFAGEENILLPEGTSCKNCHGQSFDREKDIMDVWFDSGISHFVVLEKRKDLNWPADLYLEGSDQHRGWFQTSLLTAIPLRGSAPYKTVLTSGWILDDKGRTMHKSLGNVISPLEVINSFGADVLRLALTGSDFSKDISVSKDILEQFSNIYRKIRNTLRFMLGNLHDFNESETVAYEDLGDLNHWILHKLNNLVKEIRENISEYKFYRIHHLLHEFCEKDLSSFYLDVVKDRLYILRYDHPRRRAAQTTLNLIVKSLVALIAPILPFTAEEAYKELQSTQKNLQQSIHLCSYPTFKRQFYRLDLDKIFEKILYFREEINQELEKARRNNLIGGSLESMVTINTNAENVAFLRNIGVKELEDIFIISQLEILTSEDDANGIQVFPARGRKCERCWKWSDSVGTNSKHPTICNRCSNEINEVDL